MVEHDIGFENGDGRLAEIFSPCFTLILQLRGATSLSPADALRTGLLDVLNECEQDAHRAGVSGEDVSDAKFALVSFADETLLSSDWPSKDAWIANPLQLQLYNRFDAGEQFFERLERLRAHPGARAEVLEVYYLCMTLGFKGRYLITEQEKLRSLIEETRAILGRTPGTKAGHLSPNGRPRDQVAAEVKSKLPAWVIVAIAVAVGVVLYVVMSMYVSSTANDARETIQELASLGIFSPASGAVSTHSPGGC